MTGTGWSRAACNRALAETIFTGGILGTGAIMLVAGRPRMLGIHTAVAVAWQ